MLYKTMMVLFILMASMPTKGADEYLIAVPFTQVTLEDSFWAPRIETNRTKTIPYDFQKCEETHRIRNFEIAGGLARGEHEGSHFNDSDVFKVIEGASYSLSIHPDPRLEQYLDDLIAKIAAAQEKDGYLYTARTIDPQKVDVRKSGHNRWAFLIGSHELYNVGHLYEAAAAHYRATGKRTLLDVATKNADLIDRVFGPDILRDVPGHEEIELALVKLYHVTKDRRYLDLADFFLSERGRGECRKLYGELYQDHKPIGEQQEIVGHAVRAMYYYAGVADVARITGNRDYLEAMNRLWQDMISGKLYLTGGIGAVRIGEQFGAKYELPNDTAYAETCAAIGVVFWSQRLNLLHRDASYFDVLERVLYNGLLSGVSLDGERFFYVNPLESDGVEPFNIGKAERQPWFNTSCCPTNMARFLPSLGGYVFATDGRDNIYVNLYAACQGKITLSDSVMEIRQQTRYPWEGKVKLEVSFGGKASINLYLRIPGWSGGEPVPGNLYFFQDKREDRQARVVLRVNGKPLDSWTCIKGYAVLTGIQSGDVIELDMPMPVRQIAAHPEVKADVGKIALQRGPIVYCVEQIDQAVPLNQIRIPSDAVMTDEYRGDLLGGIVVIRGKLAPDTSFMAIPYYAWNNRGAGAMKVWLDAK